tara:strand:- start:2348 stop:2626 length:279 start_codon:yes stop_codon:yes gene_type:complete
MDVKTYNKLVKVDVLTSKDLDSYKSGIFDAVVHGNKDDDKRCHHYKQGYDYGLGIVQKIVFDITETEKQLLKLIQNLKIGKALKNKFKNGAE